MFLTKKYRLGGFITLSNNIFWWGVEKMPLVKKSLQEGLLLFYRQGQNIFFPICLH